MRILYALYGLAGVIILLGLPLSVYTNYLLFKDWMKKRK